MKFCSFPFEYFYLDNYHGDVALCPWMTWDSIYIGNLNCETAEEIWNGEKANSLRERIKNGDYSKCRPEGCPFLQNRNLPDLSQEEIDNYPVAKTPKTVNLAFDFMCNQSCETCRPQKWRPILPRYANYMECISSSITDYLDNAEKISTSGHGDPFASPYMMKILTNLHPKSNNLELYLETNGVYFDKQHWDKIAHLADCNIKVNITVNSFNPHTYKFISRDGKYEKLMDNLEFARELREKGLIKHLVLTMVVQDRNFRDIPYFIKRSLNQYKADEVILRPVYQWGTMPDDVFWIKDVLNPLHPYHKEYLDILDDPIMEDPHVFNFGGRSVHEARPYPQPKEQS